MKQLLVCYKQNRKLRVRVSILTDIFVPVEDVISPQKTTLIVPKNDKIQLSDIVIIKDNNSGKIEYIGYIDTLANKVNTEMSCYPLINVFDNDFVLDQMFKTVKKGKYNESGQWVESATETEDVDVDAVEWLYKQIERAFIETEDDFQSLPLVIPPENERVTRTPVFHKRVLDTANLFEVYVDLFINTGLYVVFTDLVYVYNEADNIMEIGGIKCEIRNNNDEKLYRIYEHEPTIQSVDIVDNTFTNYNKIIATEDFGTDEDGNPIVKKDANGNIIPPQRFYFYLLNNNDITMNAKHPNRIKQVRSKAITFSLASDKGEEEGMTEEQKNESRAKSLILSIYNELQAPEYDLKIEIEMLKNDNLFLHRKIDFVSNKVYNEDGQQKNVVYTSNITKIERLNDKQVRITLGALRNSLTDFKKKVEAI